METKIISAFPGTGKTTLFKKAKGSSLIVIDSDSSKFDKNGFPDNYIKHIKKNIGKVHIILVSSHREVREALVKNGLEFTLVYPIMSSKQEYIERYKSRGNKEQFIKLLDKFWEIWVNECEEQKGCIGIKLAGFLEDVIPLYFKTEGE